MYLIGSFFEPCFLWFVIVDASLLGQSRDASEIFTGRECKAGVEVLMSCRESVEKAEIGRRVRDDEVEDWARAGRRRLYWWTRSRNPVEKQCIKGRDGSGIHEARVSVRKFGL